MSDSGAVERLQTPIVSQIFHLSEISCADFRKWEFDQMQEFFRFHRAQCGLAESRNDISKAMLDNEDVEYEATLLIDYEDVPTRQYEQDEQDLSDVSLSHEDIETTHLIDHEGHEATNPLASTHLNSSNVQNLQQMNHRNDVYDPLLSDHKYIDGNFLQINDEYNKTIVIHLYVGFSLSDFSY